jgi:hypothetical protein
MAQPPLIRTFVAYLSGEAEGPPLDTRAQDQAIFHLSDDGTHLGYLLIVATLAEGTITANDLAGSPVKAVEPTTWARALGEGDLFERAR